MEVSCQQLGPILNIIFYIIKIIQWGVPVILIVVSIFDFVKAMTASDEKKMNEAKSNTLKRLVYAVIVLLIPLIIKLLFRSLEGVLPDDGLGGLTEWIKCFNLKS